tara:strand:- start:154 stop:441 length:288 start_codon:yes stop_codon:yes gene_type:complete
MKTNISIELTDEERLNLAQKYNNTTNKKLLTRSELNDLVQNFIRALLDFDGTVKQASDTIIKTKMGKIYYYNGKKISKNEWDLVPDGPRKFYGLY